MNYHFKLWLEHEGQPILGDGMHCLLKMIRQHGSIKKASEALSMSYRQAWGNIKKAETRLGIQLLLKQVGGESGGGAQLTQEAEEMLAKYEEFKGEVAAAVEEIFTKHYR